MKSQRFILGPEVDSSELEVAQYCGCKYAVEVSSGTDALLASLMALGVSADDEAITTSVFFLRYCRCNSQTWCQKQPTIRTILRSRELG